MGATAQRLKRSISLPPDLDRAIEGAAAAEGTTVSGWRAATAAHRLKLEAGRCGIAEWERDHGPLSPEELPEGLERARAVGALGAKAGHDDVVDITVVEGALRRRDAIITSNRSHLELISKAARRKVPIEDV